MSKRQNSKDEVREVLRTLRREVQKVTQDLAKATQEIVESTQQAVRDVSPKVASTLDETMKDASVAFRRAMVGIDKETRQQQVKFLRSYRSFLAKQADIVERRLKKMSGQS